MPPLPPRTRLYTESPLQAGATVLCDEKRSHYLLHVLRERHGAQVVLFNGQDGEWLATLEQAGKKSVSLRVEATLRPQRPSPDLWLLCAPLKNGRTDGVVEKATELGVSRICPVSTRFTAIDRVNTTRLRAIATEAAEQCERMDVPDVQELTALTKLLGAWPKERTLLYADESGGGALFSGNSSSPYAVLIGPEGGFSAEEFTLLRGLPFTQALTLGPRILRADTAAIASITLVQAAAGDWHHKPAFRNEETS